MSHRCQRPSSPRCVSRRRNHRHARRLHQFQRWNRRKRDGRRAYLRRRLCQRKLRYRRWGLDHGNPFGRQQACDHHRRKVPARSQRRDGHLAWVRMHHPSGALHHRRDEDPSLRSTRPTHRSRRKHRRRRPKPRQSSGSKRPRQDAFSPRLSHRPCDLQTQPQNHRTERRTTQKLIHHTCANPTPSDGYGIRMLCARTNR